MNVSEQAGKNSDSGQIEFHYVEKKFQRFSLNYYFL